MGNVRKEDWGTEGTVKNLRESGFGFIRPTAGQVDGSDLYFHAKECARDSPFDELKVDDTVTYSVEQDDRNGKWMAVGVKAAGGGGSSGGKRRKASRDRSESPPRRSRR